MSGYTKISGISGRRIGQAAAFAAVLALPLMAGCSDARVTELAAASATMPSGASYGAPVSVGNGTARSYVVMQADAAVEVGIALSEQALEGLPTSGGHVHAPGAPPFVAPFVLEMPAGNATQYQFIGMDWNPDGHEPIGLYGTPHFDFHFYTISKEAREAIVPSDPNYLSKAANFPAAERLPAGYLDLATLGGMEVGAATVPMMGMHWVDTASPELAGAPFTETFIYGSWDGEVIFAEPMITRAFLMTKPDYRRTLPTPRVGVAPGELRIYWDEGTREYRVALTGFAPSGRGSSGPTR